MFFIILYEFLFHISLYRSLHVIFNVMTSKKTKKFDKDPKKKTILYDRLYILHYVFNRQATGE